MENWVLIVLGIVVLAVAIWWLAGSGNRRAGPKGPETHEVLRHEEEPISPVIVGPAVAPIDIPPVQQVPEPEPESLVEMPPTVEVTAPAPSGAADELTRMKGVGPKVAALLNDMGIIRFDQIAAWNDADVARVDAQLGAFKGRIARDQWVEQARLLAAGDTAGYEAKFGKLG